jgi:hypothetical protein
MTNERFEQIVDEIFDRCRATLVDRAEMYARGDRLSNFKRAGTIRGKSSVESLDGMGLKHITSLFDYIDDLKTGRTHTREEWLEKMCDTINYYGPLLLALLEDTTSITDEIISAVENQPPNKITLDHNTAGDDLWPPMGSFSR